MKPEELDDFDEEEFEMIINGLIHPSDFMMSPDFLAGAYPAPVGGGMPGGMGGMPGGMPMGGAPNFSSYDSIIAQAYDEEEED